MGVLKPVLDPCTVALHGDVFLLFFFNSKFGHALKAKQDRIIEATQEEILYAALYNIVLYALFHFL